MNCFHSINYGFLLVFHSDERYTKMCSEQSNQGKPLDDNRSNLEYFDGRLFWKRWAHLMKHNLWKPAMIIANTGYHPTGKC